MDTQMDDEVPILDEENYSTWTIEMKVNLKEIGEGVWKETIGGSHALKNKSKFAAQKEEKRNNALVVKTILSGLSIPLKESMRQCTSAKDIWLKLEETYQREKEDAKEKSSNCNDSKCDVVGKKECLEENSIKINEGKESPKTPDCNISKSDDVEYFSTSEEENIEIVCIELDDSYPMKQAEEELSELKNKVEWGLIEYKYDLVT
jgi:hypothetical protein